MGRATRWLKGLLGMKRGKENVAENSNCSERKEKNRWSFAKSGKDSAGGLRDIPAADAAWLRSLVADSDREQNKHAIAVAAASAAAADAAVAAAQAAVAVVRLTSQGRGALFSERLAAVKIQTLFRGFLARKALRALRGLVKLQALVRGYLVRKRAATTLQSMQALVRAQARVRSQRARVIMNDERRFQPEMRCRKSTESRSELHSERFSNCFDPWPNAMEESPKIVEIDTGRPKSRSRRMSTCLSEYNGDQCYQAISSPLPKKYDLDHHHHHHYTKDHDWGFFREECKFATAQNTPRFSYSGLCDGPVTPAKSVCGDSFLRPYSNCPSYMANTQSFKAKVRSLSAPKQRPETGSKKRLSLNEMMASRSSYSGVRMQRSCNRVEEEFEF